MGLIFRTSSLANTAATTIKNFPLTFEEGDGNFAWLATNLSGSVVSISGSVSLSGSLNLPSLTTTAQSNVITVDTTTGRLYYTASSAFGGSSTISTSSLLVTASATNNILTFTKGDNSTFQVAVDTGSLFGTSSWAQNVVSASYALSASNVLSSSYALSSSFAISASWAPSSTVVFAVTSSGSSIYSNVPSTSGFSTTQSVFLGTQAGFNATNAYSSIFIGSGSGYGATNADNAQFIGENAGYQATQADNSNFIGFLAGYQATAAHSSNFIGLYAGQNAGSASYSTFLGFNAGRNYLGTGVKTNNIIIGTNITLEDNRQDSINLGGVIFATGSYNQIAGAPFSGSVTTGKVGINKSLPQYTLDVSGSVGVTTLLNISPSDPLPPSGSVSTGSIAVSGSNLYFHDGTWRQVQLV